VKGAVLTVLVIRATSSQQSTLSASNNCSAPFMLTYYTATASRRNRW